MNNRSKTICIILGTFLMGMIAGGLINHSLTQHRIRKILSQRRPTALMGFFERILEPTPEQAPEIKRILDRHAAENSRLRQNFFSATQNSLKSLMEELEPLLTEEQKKRLSESLQRPPWKGPGPPHPMFIEPEEEEAKLQKLLRMTPEQTEKLRAILRDPPPPEFSRESPSDFHGQREIFRNYHEEKDRAIMELLTDEQKPVFQKHLDERKNRRRARRIHPEKP